MKQTHPTGLVPGFLVVLLLLASCSTSPSRELSQLEERHPDPALSPRDVVAIQLEAFRNNDDADSGIEVAFRFASPDNRAVTGPASRFATMMRGEAYRIMLDYDSVVYGVMVQDEDVAVQRVALARNGEVWIYDFHLRRQVTAPYEDCWMTEAVRIVPIQQRRIDPIPEGLPDSQLTV